MELLFDDDLVEAAVFLVATGRGPEVPAALVQRFHTERERCYAVLDADARQAAFARVHLEWFREWGLVRPLEAAVGQFPLLAEHLVALAFRKARTRSEEGAELYTDAEGRRRGVLALRPERFAAASELMPLLHHELGHLADMVDPAFGYSAEAGGSGWTAAQQRLVLERYRLLWNVSLDGRLVRRGLATVADEARRRDEFERAFAFLPAARRAQLFADLWNGRLARHPELLELAADPRGLHDRPAPVPGAPCPLCGFPAFEWSDPAALPAAARARIRAEFPGWRDDEPICARCAEVYQAVAATEYPKTTRL